MIASTHLPSPSPSSPLPSRPLLSLAGDAVLAKAIRTLQRHMKQFVKKKRKHPAASGRSTVKKGGEEPLPTELPPAAQTAKQAAKERRGLAEPTVEEEKGEGEKEVEMEGEEETIVKAVKEESAAVPTLREKAPDSHITEDWKEVDTPAQSPASISKEQSSTSAKLLPQRLSQELPSDLFEVDHPPSRPASRASFPSRPVSRTSPTKPALPQPPGTEDVAERRPSKPCTFNCYGKERNLCVFLIPLG